MEKVIDIRPVKRQMRASTKEKRLSMDAEIKSSADKKICNKLLNLWSVREAETVLCYVSTPIEVDTREFITTLLKSGKTVAVPRCEGDKAEMNFYRISSLDELIPGSFGVLEPQPDAEKRVVETQNTVCVVPAFMFDKKGFRLGYGKGYYDRYLSRYEGSTVGICYEENITEELFHGKYDRAVDLVLTEKHITVIEKEV